MPSISQWIGGNVVKPIIIGPDSESRQWVKPVAHALGVPWATLEKQRTGDRQVVVSLPEPGILEGRSPVMVDDIASSGRTLAEAATGLRSLGSLPVTCVVVHALLDTAAESELRAAGVAQLISTNTIEHSSNGIDIVPALAQRVRTMLPGASGTA
jgi:ribose-phosphate pyrophosphokinase